MPGDYLIGNRDGSVAVCTLADSDLPARIMALDEPALALVGKCATENIGVEKLVQNVIATPSIRWLILCGAESRGHRSGEALLQLKVQGVDATMRIQGATSWRPILKNLTLKEVTRFRRQVEVVDLVGQIDVAAVASTVRDCASRPAAPIEDWGETPDSSACERISASAPQRLELDPAGFFIILPNRTSGFIVCEHYENSGKLAHVIEGKEGALIAATVVENGLISRLDHAAYLGRELAKAELALKTGSGYTQDAALGELPHEGSCADSACACPTSK